MPQRVRDMNQFSQWTGLIADAVTVVIGVATISAYFLNRKRISSAIRLMLNKILFERAGRLRETMSRLADMNFDDKSQRKEILALLGQARGQIRPFADRIDGFREKHEQLGVYISDPTKFSEPHKRELVAEIQHLIESTYISDLK